jgi:hypothetical protein
MNQTDLETLSLLILGYSTLICFGLITICILLGVE